MEFVARISYYLIEEAVCCFPPSSIPFSPITRAFKGCFSLFYNLVGFSRVDFEDGGGELDFKIKFVVGGHGKAAIRIPLLNYCGLTRGSWC